MKSLVSERQFQPYHFYLNIVSRCHFLKTLPDPSLYVLSGIQFIFFLAITSNNFSLEIVRI